MGNIGDSISDSAPSVGTAGTGYATTINSLLTELKARLVAKIPLSSLLTNSNLDLNGQALLNAAYITLANEAVSPVASPSNRIAAYAGDIWWVSPAGPIKITNGNQLNAAGVGGITGDYTGAGPMQFRYDTANTRYDAFANQSTNTWAYVRALGFDIAGGATSTFRTRHQYTGTANHVVKWPDQDLAAGVILTGASATDLQYVGSISQFTQTYHTSKYKVLGAIDIFKSGQFTGAAGSIAVTDDVYRYNMSTAADYVDLIFRIDNEGATVLGTNPIEIKSVKWKGKINGGGYPTISVFINKSDTAPFDTNAMDSVSQAMNAATNSSGVVQTVSRALTTSYALTGDEFVIVRIQAATNNLDTYYVALEYDKQS